MFTESEVNALILAQQLVFKTKDASFIKDYLEAIERVEAALERDIEDKAQYWRVLLHPLL